VLAKLSNRRGTDPYARWCGRGGAARRPPIPISEAKRTFDKTRISAKCRKRTWQGYAYLCTAKRGRTTDRLHHRSSRAVLAAASANIAFNCDLVNSLGCVATRLRVDTTLSTGRVQAANNARFRFGTDTILGFEVGGLCPRFKPGAATWRRPHCGYSREGARSARRSHLLPRVFLAVLRLQHSNS
jgi:hypothetical protein